MQAVGFAARIRWRKANKFVIARALCARGLAGSKGLITDKISDVKFETFGCGSAIASSSMATELIKGKPLSQALELTNKAVAEALDGLPAYKMHCSVLAEEAIKAAVKDYYDKHGIAYDESKFPDCSHCDHCEA